MKSPGKTRYRDAHAWLVAQFGPEPHPGKSLLELQDEVALAEAMLQRARARARRREDWDAKTTAALYGLQAAPHVATMRPQKKCRKP